MAFNFLPTSPPLSQLPSSASDKYALTGPAPALGGGTAIAGAAGGSPDITSKLAETLNDPQARARLIEQAAAQASPPNLDALGAGADQALPTADTIRQANVEEEQRKAAMDRMIGGLVGGGGKIPGVEAPPPAAIATPRMVGAVGSGNRVTPMQRDPLEQETLMKALAALMNGGGRL